MVAVAALAGLVLGAATWSAVAVWRAAHHDGASEIAHADAIVVLGAAQYDGRPSPVFRGRLDHAVRLWQQGRAERVLTLGGNRPGDRTTEAEAGRRYLLDRGVPAEAVVAIPVGATTVESLEAAARWLHEHGLRSAFLVSDPWHNARIRAISDDLGIEGHASATWTSAARSAPIRARGYLRESLAYLWYLLAGR
jgi:uncharacterized SAM-binding protein YcdF (DUF218 family)